MIKEEWKDIPNYEGLYQASSMGNIKAVARTIFYINGKAIHRELGYKTPNISACCLNKRNTAYGYKWTYKSL